jgi:hypothetical protein
MPKILLVLGVSVIAAAVTALMYSLIWSLGSLPDSMAFIPFFLLALFGTSVTGILWFSTRKNQPFRYIESVFWGTLSFFLSSCLTLILFQLSKPSPFDLTRGLYISMSLILLPVNLLIILPIMIYGWGKATRVR